MDKEKFYTDLKIALNREKNIDESMILAQLEEWDSLGIVCVITMLADEYNFYTTIDELKQISTVKDLINTVEKIN